MFNRVRISSVGRVLDCRAGGRGFDSRGRTNTQGLKITEKMYSFRVKDRKGFTLVIAETLSQSSLPMLLTTITLLIK